MLLDDGESCAQIAKFFYLDDDTIRGWYKTYRESGWDALSTDGWKGGQSRMTSAQEAELCTWLDERFCRSTAEIRAHISGRFGLNYSHSGCIKLLSRLGYEYRKPKGLPRVVSVEKQAEFIALYERLLNELGEPSFFPVKARLNLLSLMIRCYRKNFFVFRLAQHEAAV